MTLPWIARVVAGGAALTLALALAACGSPTPSPAKPSPATAVPSAAGSVSAVAPPSGTRPDWAPASLAPQQVPAAATSGKVTVGATSVTVGAPTAPHAVRIFMDMMCRYCLDLHKEMAADTAAWAQGDQVAIEYTVVNYLGPRTTHNFSGRAANILALVADIAPAKWTAVVDQLFAIRPVAGTDEVTNDQLVAAVKAAGVELSADNLAAVQGLAYYNWVDAATSAAAQAGINSIPQVLVGTTRVEGKTIAEVAANLRTVVGGPAASK